MSRPQVDSLLGKPDAVQDMGQGVQGLSYRSRGLSIVISELDGLSVVYATRRDWGDLDGVRVGDTRERVVQKWGAPDRGDGHAGIYLFGRWLILVRLDDSDSHVVQLGLGFDASKQ